VGVRVEAGDVAIRVANPIVAGEVVDGAGVGAGVGAAVGVGVGVGGGGQGVKGMAERAQLLGGSARAGNGDGTWRVEAHIPWRHPE
jgi:hypothetical protein